MDHMQGITGGVHESVSGQPNIPLRQRRHLPVAVVARHHAILHPEVAAIALCKNQKTDDNELYFNVGDRITEIDMIEEDRWWGKNPRGESGLFPATSVQLPPFLGPLQSVTDGSQEPNPGEFDVPYGYELKRTSTSDLLRLVPKTEYHKEEIEDTLSHLVDNTAPTATLQPEGNADTSTLPLQESSRSTMPDDKTGPSTLDHADELYDDDLHPGMRTLSDLGTRVSKLSDAAQDTLKLLQGAQGQETDTRTREAKNVTNPADLESNTSNRSMDYADVDLTSERERLQTEIMAILKDPSFRIADMKTRGFGSHGSMYDVGHLPATASSCSFISNRLKLTVDRDDLKTFDYGLLVVENVDVPWIEALASVGVPLTFLLDHVIRHPVYHDFGEYGDALRFTDKPKDGFNDFKSVHWDGVFDTYHRAIQVLGQTAKCRLPTLEPTDTDLQYTRLSFCRISPARYVALVDRPSNPVPASPFRKGMPILPGYLAISENSQETLSLKHTLTTYFRTRDRSSRIDQLFDDQSTLWWYMAADAFQHMLTVFSYDLNYFTFEAVNQPRISDFQKLNQDRKHIDQILKHLNVCGAPIADSSFTQRSTEEEMRIVELQRQASTMWQEYNNTFQLLIGVLSVIDSDISKTQARRSTALTVLAAIYLPFSLATGVYGMNIKEINNGFPTSWAVVALGMGLLVITLIVVYIVLRDKAGSAERATNDTDDSDADTLEKGRSGPYRGNVPFSKRYRI